mgnify:CR=1 FL=1
MKAKTIAFGGCLAALSVLFLYLASVFPTGKVVLLAVASFCIGVAVVQMRVPQVWVLYGAVSILALLLVPDKLVAILYAVCLGNYPIVKLYIEKLGKLVLEWGCKLACYVVYAALAYLLYCTVLGNVLDIPYALWLVFLGGAVVFVLYDLAFSLFMTEVSRRFPKIFQSGAKR